MPLDVSFTCLLMFRTAGIGWLAVDINPILFQLIGLGMGLPA